MKSPDRSRPPGARDAGIRLVIADDHHLFLLGLRQLLARQADIVVVAEAATGLTAVAAAVAHRPDVVLLDISMPDLNGIDAARRIQEEAPGSKVLIVSMHADRRYVTEALRAGARGYVLKSCPPEEVLRAIRRVNEGGVYLAEEIEAVVAEFVQHTPSRDDSAFGVLTSREREVLQLLAEGKTTRQIGDLLGVSAKTVETHRQHIMDKLNLRSIAELTRYAIREGLTPLD